MYMYILYMYKKCVECQLADFVLSRVFTKSGVTTTSAPSVLPSEQLLSPSLPPSLVRAEFLYIQMKVIGS